MIIILACSFTITVAACTKTKEDTMSGERMDGSSHSVVSACDVTDCTHNKEHQCHAGSIQVAFVDGMAHCATYHPSDSAIGSGSERAGQGAAAGKTRGSTQG
jgi:hypothetical protein